MEKINVLIVDDKVAVREGFKMVFSGSKSIDVTGEASDGVEAIELVKKNDYDVVLMDINMPKLNGIEATKSIRKIQSGIKILANTFYVTPIYIKEVISAGASGFITKGESGDSYIDAIENVFNGIIYLSEEVNSSIYDEVLTSLKQSA